MASIHCLELHFPHGVSVDQCDFIARMVQGIVNAGVSEGGMKIQYIPLTKEQEKKRGVEFYSDVMSYTHGHKKKE